MIDVWLAAERDPWDLDVRAPGLGARAWDQRQDLFGLLASGRGGDAVMVDHKRADDTLA